MAWYAGGAKQPQPLQWTSSTSSSPSSADADQLATWRRMLSNYHENLLLIEERMSEYVEFTTITLQLVKAKRHIEDNIADLEQKLGVGTARWHR